MVIGYSSSIDLHCHFGLESEYEHQLEKDRYTWKETNTLGRWKSKWKSKLESYYGESIDAAKAKFDEVLIGYERLQSQRTVFFCCFLKRVNEEMYEMHKLKCDNDHQYKDEMLGIMVSKHPCLAMQNPVLPNTRDFLKKHGFNKQNMVISEVPGKLVIGPRKRNTCRPLGKGQREKGQKMFRSTSVEQKGKHTNINFNVLTTFFKTVAQKTIRAYSPFVFWSSSSGMQPKKSSAQFFQSGAAYILKPMYVCTMPGTPGNYSPCGK